jgi:hypothetical protein
MKSKTAVVNCMETLCRFDDCTFVIFTYKLFANVAFRVATWYFN